MKVPKGTPPTGIRFIQEIKEFYVDQAVKNGRSLNSEIMQVLKEAMDARIKKQKHKEAA